MSIGRPSRMTPEVDAIFEEQARVWERRKSLKELSQMTGFAPSHCWEQIHIRIEKIRVSENNSVPRETDPVTLQG